MTIEDYLIGHWSNRLQAQSNPHRFTSVELIWNKIDGGLESYNYMRHKGSHSPYRKKYHTVNRISDREVIIQNHFIDWTRNENCDMIFKFDGEKWIGNLLGCNCTGSQGERVVSEMHLFGNKIHTMDQGYESNKMIWGSAEFYRFTRIKGE